VSCIKTRRLFLALWPDDATRQRLQDALERVTLNADAKRVPPDDWHVTLAFLGTVPEVARPSIEALTVGWPPLRPCVLDKIAYWPESRVLVAVAEDPPTDWLLHRSRLVHRLQALGLRTDLRPWRPHVTLVRGVSGQDGASAALQCSCAVDRVALVESLLAPGPNRYQTLASQRLI